MMASMLKRLQTALTGLTDRVYHYFAGPNTAPPYIVWAEDGDHDLMAGNGHAERCSTGTVDLFTNQEDDPLLQTIPVALREIEAAWYLNSVQFEQDTGLLHYEWVWSVV